MIVSAGDCEDTEYFLNKLKAISSNSIWVYERKNVLENGYWYMLTFDKQNKKVFGNQLESVYVKLKLVEGYSMQNFRAAVLSMTKEYSNNKPSNTELRRYASDFLQVWEKYFNLVASKWPDAIAIDLTKSNTPPVQQGYLGNRAFTDTRSSVRNYREEDTSREAAAAWSKIMAEHNKTNSMDSPLPNNTSSNLSRREAAKSEHTATITIEKSVLEPLIAEALELLISTDDEGLFYEDMRSKTSWDLSKVVDCPMSLGRMHAKLEAHSYNNLDELNDDIELMVSNCEQCFGADNFRSRLVRELHAVWRTKWVALRSRLTSTVDTTKATKATGKNSSASKPSNGSSSSSYGNSSSYASSGSHSSSGGSSSSSGGVKTAAAASSNSLSTTAKGKATPPVTAAATAPASATITAMASESAPVAAKAEVPITTSASVTPATAAAKVDEKAILLQEMRDIDADSAEQLLWRVFDIGLEYLHLVDKNKRFQTKDAKGVISLHAIEHRILNNDNYTLKTFQDDVNRLVDQCQAAHPVDLALMQDSFVLLAGWKEYYKQVTLAWPILALASPSGVAAEIDLELHRVNTAGSAPAENSPKTPERSVTAQATITTNGTMALPSSPSSPSSVSSASTIALPAAPTSSTSASKKRQQLDHPVSGGTAAGAKKKMKCATAEGEPEVAATTAVAAAANTTVAVPLQLQVDILKFLVQHGQAAQQAIQELLATVAKNR